MGALLLSCFVGTAGALPIPVAGAIAVIFSINASAAVITYTDQSAWEAAISGSILIEDFNGSASSFSANSNGNSIGTVTTVDLIGGDGDAGPTGLTGGGFFQGEVDSSSFTTGDGLDLDFNISSAMGFALIGLQNDSTTYSDGLDLEEIGIIVNGEDFLISDILGLTDSSDNGGESVSTVNSDAPIPFIGFISDSAISGFRLTHGDSVAPYGVSGGDEEFYLNELRIATVPVPAPAPLALIGLGLAAIGFTRRRKAA